MTELAPVILNREAQVRVTVSDDVRATARRIGQATYIFAVGLDTRRALDVSLKVAQLSGEASVIGEDRVIAVHDETIRDAFEPLAVHLYVVR